MSSEKTETSPRGDSRTAGMVAARAKSLPRQCHNKDCCNVFERSSALQVYCKQCHLGKLFDDNACILDTEKKCYRSICGTIIKVCDSVTCEEPFVPAHGHQKYCTLCPEGIRKKKKADWNKKDRQKLKTETTPSDSPEQKRRKLGTSEPAILTKHPSPGTVPQIDWRHRMKKSGACRSIADLMLQYGAVLIRSYLTKQEAEMLLMHSRLCFLRGRATTEELIGGGKQIFTTMTSNDELLDKNDELPVTSEIKKKCRDFMLELVGCVSQNEMEVDDKYIHCDPDNTGRPLIHADSYFQDHFKSIVYLSECQPTICCPYSLLGDTPLKPTKEGLEKMEIFDLRRRFAPMVLMQGEFLPSLLYGRKNRRQPVCDGRMKPGDMLVFCGDFLHAGPENKDYSRSREMYFLSCSTKPNDDIARVDFDRQVHPGDLANRLYDQEKEMEWKTMVAGHLIGNRCSDAEIDWNCRLFLGINQSPRAKINKQQRKGLIEIKEFLKNQKLIYERDEQSMKSNKKVVLGDLY